MLPHVARFTVLAATVAVLEVRPVDSKDGSVRARTDPDAEMATVGRQLLGSMLPPVATDRELAATVVLDFEGVGDHIPVGSFYDGVGGPDYGVVFGASAMGLVDEDAGGSGNSANEPSGQTTLLFVGASNTYVTVAAGFTGLSLKYASYYYPTVLTVYDGPDGTGSELATMTLPSTGLCGTNFPECGDPTGEYGKWTSASVPPFSGVARSARFTGVGIEDFILIDDVAIVLADPPMCTKTTYWLWDPKTDTQVGELLDNSASCIAVPYNIEVRPCHPPATTPVFIKLTNVALKTVKRQNEYFAPYYLWGDTTSTGDVYKNTQPLPKGTYFLCSNVDGVVEKIKFTQTC